MKSPITGKEMKLVREPLSLPYRKEEFPIVYHYYLCEESKEQFTDDALDAINQNQVNNKYREKYGIPFPEEILNIREKYSVSASKMSEILGFGVNTYRLYEAGEMPSVSNGRLILSIKQPEEFIKQVNASRHILSEKEVNKLFETAKSIQRKDLENMWSRAYEKQIFSRELPDQYTGYKKPNLAKITHIITYFSQSMTLFKTKLNKLLFYVDFLHYKRTGYSITGIAYRAIKFGLVPAEYDKLYNKLAVDDKRILLEQFPLKDGNFGEIYKGIEPFQALLFSSSELKAIEDVLARFSTSLTEDVVRISHDEPAWLEKNESKELISYAEYGFRLKELD